MLAIGTYLMYKFYITNEIMQVWSVLPDRYMVRLEARLDKKVPFLAFPDDAYILFKDIDNYDTYTQEEVDEMKATAL